MASSSAFSGPLNLLDCRVCSELPRGKIFQCRKGHIMCSECVIKVTTCPNPECGVPLRKRSRSWASEVLLNLLSLPCPNHVKGCEVVLKREEINSHLEACEFEERNKTFKLCKWLGLSCEFEMKMATSVEEGLGHFRYQHGVVVAESNVLTIIHQWSTWIDGPPSLEVAWTPVVIRVKDAYVLVLSATNNKTRCFGVRAVVVWVETGEAGEMEVSFRIKRGDVGEAKVKVEDVKWKITPNLIPQKTGSIESVPAFWIPLESLHSLKDKGITLAVNVSNGNYPSTENVLNVNLVASPAKHLGLDSIAECDECGASLAPIRYKCLQCVEYDLCQECMSKAVHSEHVFAMLRNKGQEEHVLHKVARACPTGTPIVSAKSPTRPAKQKKRDSESFLSRCDGCGVKPIVGIHYACLVCPRLDLCRACVDTGFHQDLDHSFAVILNHSQEELVKRLRVGSIEGIIPST